MIDRSSLDTLLELGSRHHQNTENFYKSSLLDRNSRFFGPTSSNRKFAFLRTLSNRPSSKMEFGRHNYRDRSIVPGFSAHCSIVPRVESVTQGMIDRQMETARRHCANLPLGVNVRLR